MGPESHTGNLVFTNGSNTTTTSHKCVVVRTRPGPEAGGSPRLPEIKRNWFADAKPGPQNGRFTLPISQTNSPWKLPRRVRETCHANRPCWAIPSNGEFHSFQFQRSCACIICPSVGWSSLGVLVRVYSGLLLFSFLIVHRLGSVGKACIVWGYSFFVWTNTPVPGTVTRNALHVLRATRRSRRRARLTEVPKVWPCLRGDQLTWDFCRSILPQISRETCWTGKTPEPRTKPSHEDSKFLLEAQPQIGV